MKRYVEFDLARVVALILMPLVHILESASELQIVANEVQPTRMFLLSIAGLGASVFMFCLGINYSLTNHQEVKDYLKRGWILFIAGAILNVIRFAIPYVLGYLATNEILYLQAIVRDCFASDIMYFSALAFFFYALCKKLNLKPLTIFLIGIGLNILNGLIDFPEMSENLSFYLGNFFYINRFSCFAFFQWFIFPAAGNLFYSYFINQENKDSFYKDNFILGSVGLIVFSIFLKIIKLNPLELFATQITYETNLYSAIINLFVVLMVMSLAYFVTKLIKNNNVINWIINFSKNINLYYCIQWILVTWFFLVYLVVDENMMITMNNFWFIGFGIIITSYFLTDVIAKRKEKKKVK